MRKLSIQKSVLKDLEELPAKQYRQVVSAMLDLLNDPMPHYSKKLQGSSYMRLALGEYRLIYEADEQAVFIYAFGKRNDDAIYKQLARLPKH